MSILLWCLFIAGLLHVVSKTPIGIAQSKLSGGYDNELPREQLAQLDDYGKRASAAHQNQIESFPLFAAGVLVALFTGTTTAAIDFLAITYIVARLLYLYAYLKNLATFRSTIWFVGFAASLALLCSPLWA